MNPHLKALIEIGIPVKRAIFQTAVNNAGNIPCHQFDVKSDKKDRRADMWSTPSTLVCHQKGHYWEVPKSNIIQCDFLAEEVKDEVNIVVHDYTEPAKKRGRPFSKPA